MPLDNEFVTVYSDEKEFLKTNLEDLKRFRETQKEKRTKKSELRENARLEAKRQGLELGRWEGTYAKVKNGDGWFHLNTLTVVTERPGKQDEQ